MIFIIIGSTLKQSGLNVWGVLAVDMKNVCTQLEDRTFGKIVHRLGGTLVLYRGRNYNPRRRPVIPIMLWRPHEPIYPRLIRTTIEGLSIEETKEMRKKGPSCSCFNKACQKKVITVVWYPW